MPGVVEAVKYNVELGELLEKNVEGLDDAEGVNDVERVRGLFNNVVCPPRSVEGSW